MGLSEELRARICAEFPKYPEKRAVLLTALHFIQAEHHWIRPEFVPEVAELLGIEPIDVLEVVSFYSMFHDEPVGKCHVQVCSGLPCALNNSRGLVRELEEHLAIRAGEVTEDGIFSLKEVECLGSCGSAPVMQVNNEPYVENVKQADVAKILSGLRARAASNGRTTR